MFKGERGRRKSRPISFVVLYRICT